MCKYYDWAKTLAYDADVTMVVGGRGIGKTFGLRVQVLRDYLKKHLRFVVVCRYKNEIQDISRGFFDRIAKLKEFKAYQFKSEKKSFYIASAKDKKPKWKLIGYIVALTEMQKTKQSTFNDVYRIILDEAILDKTDKFHRYLPKEYVLLANIVDSCSRERADSTNARPPRLYLLGNAVDLINPYFMRYGINEPPKYGYSWYDKKTFLLHYVEDKEYAKAKETRTVAGRMLAGTEEGNAANANIFVGSNKDFINKKPRGCMFNFGIVYQGQRFGVWYDKNEGYFYIDNKISKAQNTVIYALTCSDNRINYYMVKKSNRVLQSLVELAGYGQVQYETIATRENFYKIIKLFGIL